MKRFSGATPHMGRHSSDVGKGGRVLRGTGLCIASAVSVLLAACGGGTEQSASSPAPQAAARVQPTALAAPKYNYAEALQKSVLFYEAQQSGKLPTWNRVSWRGDSRLSDGSDVGHDLTGGWYDAGDHVKFGFPMAATATHLAWGVLEFEAGYKDAGQYDAMLRNLRFVNDYFLKAHTAPNELYGQVGNGSTDHSWWGPVEVYPKAAPAYKIDASCGGSELAAETAAAMTAASLVFKSSDPAYSAKLLTHAKQLFTFADTVRKKYSECITDAAAFYNSWSGYYDELAWAAAWLHKATGDAAYLSKAESFVDSFGTEGQSTFLPYKWTNDWDSKHYGAYILLAQATGKSRYVTAIERNLAYWTTGIDGERVKYTPGGLAWLAQWGSLRYALDQSLIAMIYANHVADAGKKTTYRNFAMSQLHYALGDNPRKGSYLIGFGTNWPKSPHHRTAHGSYADSMSVPTNHRHTLYGAMVGGPGTDDSYTDSVSDFVSNEVATDYNMGVTGVLAAAQQLYPGSKPLANFPQVEVPTEDQYFVEAGINSSGNTYTEIKALLNNRSGWPAKMGDKLSFRYFVDLTEVFAAGKTAADIKVSANYSAGGTAKGLFRCGTSNIFYAVGDFTGTQIYPGGQSAYRKEIQIRIAAPDGSNYWSPTNDPSYAGLSSAAVKTVAIPVYENGKLIYGKEPTACGGDPIPVPAVPTSVSASGGNGEIGLVWAASANAKSYTVKRSSSGSAGSFALLANTTETAYTDSGLPANTTYYYVVSASNDGGSSADSVVVSAKTAATAPAAPVVSATAGNAQVSLSWAAVSGATSYEVARSTSAGGSFTNVVTGLTSTSYVDKLLTNGTTYYYKVSARNAVGATASAVVSAKPSGDPLLPPAVPTASAVAGDAKVTLNWSAASGATGYTVQRAPSAGGSYTNLASLTASATSYLDAGLTNDTTYFYKVLATNSAGSTPSAVVSATPKGTGGGGACTLTLDSSNDWGSGQVLRIVLANTGTAPISNWKISFSESNDFTIGNSWNGSFTKAARTVTVTPASWNTTIAPNSTMDAGMQIGYSGAKPVPSSASVAGQSCKIELK